MEIISKVYFKLLLLWACIMLVWGFAGFFENITNITPIVPLQNKIYPNGIQFVHWLLISVTGLTFLIGYITKWKWTPFTMMSLFSNLAILCTIETFDFMSEQWSFLQYFTELIFYLITSIFLLFTTISKEYFNHYH